MSQIYIANAILISQQLIKSEFKSPEEIVGWMSAMQAQEKNGMITNL